MDFLKKAQEIYKDDDYLAIKYALDFATEAHKNQKRASGEPYIIHPMAVADILMDFGLDSDTIVAALLHDVIEDTEYTEEDIKTKFGNGIYEMVMGVTKLTRINFSPENTDTDIELAQAETIRKLFFAMAKDIRVLLVKLADRLHNMRTLEHLAPEKRLRKSRETLDIYAPLAGRLGISGIKCELEDLSMKYLYPDDYEFLSQKLNSQRINRMHLVERVAESLSSQLNDLGIRYEIKGRPKHFYSIFKKMRNQGKTFEEIYDLVAVRVIVDTISDCYTVLGLIHSMWKPVPGRFKDYIASPKPNMYQSLHTTIVTDFGQIFEVQIRTVEMNRIAEYGIAAHWKYKEGISSRSMSELDKKLGWIKEVMDVQGDLKDSLEFLDTLKMNVSTNEIFIFTPKGTVIDLPVGSTAIDFAYRIHSEVGNRCIGIKVNNKIKPVNTVLENGDVVEVITSNSAKGPSRDWLNFVKTPTAKAKIRSYFKKAMKTENIKLGKDMLEEEAKRRGYALGDLMLDSSVKLIMDKHNLNDTDDMYATVGCGGIKSQQIVAKLIEFYKKAVPKETTYNFDADKVVRPKLRSGITVEGFDDFLINIARCCNPLPGDEIVGYITRGRGVMVHKSTCPNIKNVERERLLSANWSNVDDSLFNAPLHIETDTNNYVLAQITGAIVKLNLRMTSFNASESKTKDKMIVKLVLEIHNSDDLDKAIKKLSTLKGVIKVERENVT
ncbi:MAG: RelA/SpoT family protein [Christensenellales bacterium]